MSEILSPIVLSNVPERKVFGPVLIPDEPDFDGDIVSAEKISQAHDLFMLNYKNIDVQHSLQNVGKVYTSYILPEDTNFNISGNSYSFPQGTWMMGVKVEDDTAWSLVEAGILTGFSIMAINPLLQDSAIKGENGRTTLADLGPNWIVNAVSLVDRPAVQRAKFISIKSAPSANDELLTTKIVKGLQTMIHLISTKSQEPMVSDNKNQEVLDMNPDELKKMIMEVCNECMQPVLDQLKAMQEEDAKEDADEAKEDAAEDATETSEDPATEPTSTKDEDVPAAEDSAPAQIEATPESDSVDVDQLKEQLAQAQAKIEELMASTKSARSKKIYGQDGIAEVKSTKSYDEDRDMFGRKLRK